MDKLTKEAVEKINSIRDRYEKINNLFDGNFKKKLILYDDINYKLNEIEELLDNFEVNNENDIDLDLEVESRIEENKEFRKLINILAPYIIMHQLNKLDNI